MFELKRNLSSSHKHQICMEITKSRIVGFKRVAASTKMFRRGRKNFQ